MPFPLIRIFWSAWTPGGIYKKRTSVVFLGFKLLKWKYFTKYRQSYSLKRTCIWASRQSPATTACKLANKVGPPWEDPVMQIVEAGGLWRWTKGGKTKSQTQEDVKPTQEYVAEVAPWPSTRGDVSQELLSLAMALKAHCLWLTSKEWPGIPPASPTPHLPWIPDMLVVQRF